MTDKQPDALRLADWFDEANGFNQGTKAPHKWVLQSASELRRLHAVNEGLMSFVESLVSGWDCDTDAHKYGTQCRKCEAAKLIAAEGAKP